MKAHLLFNYGKHFLDTDYARHQGYTNQSDVVLNLKGFTVEEGDYTQTIIKQSDAGDTTGGQAREPSLSPLSDPPFYHVPPLSVPVELEPCYNLHWHGTTTLSGRLRRAENASAGKQHIH